MGAQQSEFGAGGAVARSDSTVQLTRAESMLERKARRTESYRREHRDPTQIYGQEFELQTLDADVDV